MKFTPDILQASLAQMPACDTAVVGLSGGLDSVVLLHALAQLRSRSKLPFTLRALHIHHGLNARADQWQQFCQRLCADWDVAFESQSVQVLAAARDVDGKPAAGLENAARNARYQAFAEHIASGEALLLAHHRDDQMETLLLRLLRGAGSKGLAGMPQARPLAAGTLFRPLLDCDRADLEQYAAAMSLEWIEDDSNAELHFDRNYCRHQVLPMIEARWPAYRESWSKSAVLAAESDALLQELASMDLQNVSAGRSNELRLDALTALSGARQRNLLRAWMQQLGLPEPGWQQLHTMSDELIPAAGDSNAQLKGEGFIITRFRNALLALRDLPAIDIQARIEWNLEERVRCELVDNGQLLARTSDAGATDAHLALKLTGPVQVRYRQGGESCQLRGRPHKSLKKLLQEHGVEPWARQRMPLLYCQDELVCVPGIGVADSVAAAASEGGLIIDWQPPAWHLPHD